jgi:hypothetical protein
VDASVLLSTSGVVRPISRWVAKVGLLLDLSAFGCWSRAFFAVPLCFSSCKYFSGYSLHVCRFSCENLF